MNFLPGWTPGAAGAGGGAAPAPDSTITFTQAAHADGNTTSFNFNNISMGSEAANRYIIVGTGGQGTSASPLRSVTGLTVGGNAATKIVEAEDTATNSRCSALFIIHFPTGATANISVTFNAAMQRVGIGVWAATLQSATPTDFDFDDSTTPMSASIDIAAGGVAVGYANADSDPSFGWTNLTEDFEVNIDGSFDHSGASAAFALAQTGLAIGCSASGGNGPNFVVASFR